MKMSDPQVFITLKAMAKMIHFDQSHPNKETAGLLIGKYDEKSNSLYVEDIEVGDQRGTAVHVEISEQALVDIVVKMSQRDDGSTIVGWWHTHPGLSSFMSSTDVTTQRNYQNLFDKAIGIVIDPLKFQQTHRIEDLDFGVYRVKNGEYYRIPYQVIDAVPFGLSLYLGKDHVESPVSYKVDKKKLSELKSRLKTMEGKIRDEDLNAMNAWIELVETMDEVPENSGNPVSKIIEEVSKLESVVRQHYAAKINKENKETFFSSIFLMLIVAVVFFLITGL